MSGRGTPMLRCAVAALALLSSLAPSSARPDAPCPADADAAPDRFGASWQLLYSHYRRVGRCDDGAVAEGFSEAVLSLLAKSWKELPQLAKLAAEDPGFRAFVLRHLDDLLGEEPLVQIHEHATRECAPGLEDLCADIAARATERLAAIRKSRRN